MTNPTDEDRARSHKNQNYWEAKARAQEKYYADLIEKNKHARYPCASCGRQSSDGQMLYYAEADEYLCKSCEAKEQKRIVRESKEEQ